MISNLECNSLYQGKDEKNRPNCIKRKAVEPQQLIEYDSQLEPIPSRSIVTFCGGLKIALNIEDNQSRYFCESPGFNSLTIDPTLEIKECSVAADMIRLFATHNFWTAALNGDQKAVDDQARKLVPVIPFWKKSTWQRVAKMSADQQYAVAIWISEHCSRRPQLRATERIDILPVLIESWVNFDKNSRWMDPALARASKIQNFLRIADKFIQSLGKNTASDHASKRINRKGRDTKLVRTKLLIEASMIWKARKKPSIKAFNRILVDELGWGPNWHLPKKTGQPSELIKLARESIKLARARHTI